ncbi:MAG: hypothetical protein LBH96_02755 [Candidatus Peribacteria bacterium]|nr:hypothetical protein [Candidatus Peribacteria bacterium]
MQDVVAKIEPIVSEAQGFDSKLGALWKQWKEEHSAIVPSSTVATSTQNSNKTET